MDYRQMKMQSKKNAMEHWKYNYDWNQITALNNL